MKNGGVMKKFLGLIICFICWKVMAADVFVMTDIPVSAEGESAVIAREIVMTEGQKKAFEALMDKIVVPERRADVTITSNEVSAFVQDISVAHEKMGGNRYQGDLTVRFNAPLVRAFLQKQAIPFLTRLPEPMLLVPIFDNEGQISIFDENNPLYLVLRSQTDASDLFQLRVPDVLVNSDGTTMVSINFSDMQTLSYETLKPLLELYKLNAALVIYVSKNGVKYTLSTQVFPDEVAPEAVVSLNTIDARTDLVQVMRDLSTAALKTMTKKWRYLMQETASAPMLYHVSTPIEKVSDLSRIQQKVRQMRFAEQVDIKGFTNGRLVVDFYFRGSAVDLAQKLALSDMHLFVAETGDVAPKEKYLMVESGSPLLLQISDGVLMENGIAYTDMGVHPLKIETEQAPIPKVGTGALINDAYSMVNGQAFNKKEKD